MFRRSVCGLIARSRVALDGAPPGPNRGQPEAADEAEDPLARFGGRGPDEKGVMSYLQGKTAQAAKDAEATKKLGVKGAIEQGRQSSAEAMQKGQVARESANKYMSLMKPGERLRALATGKYDPGQHYLMLDLDFERDSLIFGNTREQFYENVDKMKRVIIEYHRWERNDNFYLYGTRVLQFLSCMLIYDAWEQERFKYLLASSLDNYRAHHDEELALLEHRREEALERAVLELEVRPPNFVELIAERKRLEAKSDDEAKREYKPHPMDTMQHEREKFEDMVERKRALVRNALSPASIPAVKNLRRVLMPQTSDWTVVVREEMLEYREAKARAMNIPDREDEAAVPRGTKQQTVAPLFDVVPQTAPQPARA